MAKAVSNTVTKEIGPVSELISGLDHRFKPEIAEMRVMILGLDPRFTEKIKWNAPSFCWDGKDRVTFKLQPRECFQIIFHRGAGSSGKESVTVSDPKGLLKWAAPDRAVATISDADYFRKHKQALLDLVFSWVRST